MDCKNLKPAIFHDWLTGMRGGEKCLEALLDIFPNAEVFTLFYEPSKISQKINERNIHVHPISKIGIIKKKYRNFIPVFPLILGKWPKLNGFDFVISSSHCVAKSFNSANLPHLCYCYSPMRYIWDMFDDYFLKESVPLWKKAVMKTIRKPLQNWDKTSAQNVHQFIAISSFIGERIQNCYDKKSEIIYPFADLEYYHISDCTREDYYLVVSALVPYKNIEIVVNAFNQSKRKLVVIGTGPEESALKELASENITFCGWAENDTIRSHYQKAKAFIFPGVEDFGITPVEAMACGCPIIAYKKGGTLETVIDITEDSENGTGLFYNESNANSLNRSIDEFENMKNSFSNTQMRKQANNFSVEKYKKSISKIVNQILLSSNG